MHIESETPGRAIATGLVRIIARRVPWPSLSARSDRSGLRLRWDALTEDGDLLVGATEHPLTDGAHILLSERALRDDLLVTMRHESAAYDSFVPAPLRIVAAEGARRAGRKAALADFRATFRQNKAGQQPAGGQAPVAANGAVGGGVQ